MKTTYTAFNADRFPKVCGLILEIWLLYKLLEKLKKYSVNYVYTKINNIRQHLHRMALLENNVRRRLSYSYLMERNLKLFCSTKITQIHETITLKMILLK